MSLGGSKKANTSNGAIPSPSITRPASFQLDAFDLLISEETMSAHIRPSEQLILEDVRRMQAIHITYLIRAAARSLCKSFSSQKLRKEEEKASIFKILEGKKKRESALLFYEILVLKSGGYVYVKQQAPYDDIIVSGTCKLKNFCDF